MNAGNHILGAMIAPVMAYAGLAAAALPVLIHLFNRRRFRRVRWAAVEFLLEAQRRNRRRLRVEELILLALRCLAMALIGLMLSRWFVRPESLFASLGANTRTEHIIIVDDSYSMGAHLPSAEGAVAPASADGRHVTVFDDACSAVLALVEHVRAVAPQDSMTILLASHPAQPIRTAASLAQVPAQTWSDDIKAMQRSQQAGNMRAAFQAVRGLLDARKTSVRAAVYVVSDFQAIDWLPKAQPSDQGRPAQPDSSAGPSALLADWAGRDRAIELLLIDVGRPVDVNRCVANVRADQPQAIAGVVGRYVARVVNSGERAAPPGQLRVFMGDTALPPVPVPGLEPNQTVEVPVELTFGQEGSSRLTVELDADALPDDNLRWSVVPVERALRLLLVNGEASPDAYQDEAHLLNVALRPEGPEFSGNETTLINDSELEVVDLSNYHAVLLLNVNRVTEQTRSRLEAYAAAGGGVVFFLGDQVDGLTYNRLLYRGGAGLLPAMLGDQSTAPQQEPGYHLEAADSNHPAIGRLGSAAGTLLSGGLVWQWFNCESSATQEAEPSATAPADHAATSQPATRPPARVLLRLSNPERSAALIERGLGRGHVLMWTTSADREWNNLANQPVFVVLIMELMQRVARPAESTGEQWVGQPIRLPLDLTAFQPTALLRLPSYPDTPAIRVDLRMNGEPTDPRLEWADTQRPGLYTFELQRTGGEQLARSVAVNLDPRESDLRRADRSALLASMGALPVQYVTGTTLTSRTLAEARQELWPVVLVCVTLLLMLEQGLAWWFGADRQWRRAFRKPTAA